MAASAFHPHDSTALFMSDGTLDMDNDVFTLAIGSVGSNFDALAVRFPSSLTGEISNVAAIRRSTCGNHTWAIVNQSTVRFDSDDVAVTAVSTTIRAKYIALISTTASVVLASSTLSTDTNEVTVTDGGVLTIQMNALGLFQVRSVQSG